jgi:hypothetical protein
VENVPFFNTFLAFLESLTFLSVWCIINVEQIRLLLPRVDLPKSSEEKMSKIKFQSVLSYVTFVFAIVGLCCGYVYTHRTETTAINNQRVTKAIATVELPLTIEQSPFDQLGDGAKYIVRKTQDVRDVPGMQLVFVTRIQGKGYMEFAILAPTSESFTLGQEVILVRVRYTQSNFGDIAYALVLTKKNQLPHELGHVIGFR